MIIFIGLPIFVAVAVICFRTRADMTVTMIFSCLATLFFAFAIIIPTEFSSKYEDLQKEKDELIIEILTYDYNAVDKDVMERKIKRFNEKFNEYKKENNLLNILSVFQGKPEDILFPDDYLDNVLKERQEKVKELPSKDSKEERKKVEIDGKKYELVPIT